MISKSITLFLERVDMDRLLRAEKDIGRWADREWKDAKRIDDQRQKKMQKRN